MLTVDALRQFGANTREGLGRCMNNEGFYLRLVNMELEDKSFAALAAALEQGDRQAAFEAAHSLKGSLGNLALTPLYTPAAALTERLRNPGGETGCEDLLAELQRQLDTLRQLRE